MASWVVLDPSLQPRTEFDGLGAKHVQEVRGPSGRPQVSEMGKDTIKKRKSSRGNFNWINLQYLHFDLVVSPMLKSP